MKGSHKDKKQPSLPAAHLAGNSGAAPRGQTRRLRLFFLVPLAVVISLLAVVSVTTGYLYANREAERQLERAQDSAPLVFHHSIMHNANMLGAVMEVLQRDDVLKAALARRDRETLLARAAPLLADLKRKYGITHFYFHAPDRTNLLRVQQPDWRGGVIDRYTLREAERTGRTAYGVELGSRGLLTLRLATPWYGDGPRRSLLGYVELGLEVDRVLQEMGGILHAQVYALIFKEYLKRGPWEEGARMIGRDPQWDRFPDAVLSAQSEQGLPAAVAAKLARGVPRDASGVLRVDSGAQHFLGAVVPLPDASGRKVAEMLVLLDVSRQIHGARQVMWTGSLVALAISAGLLLFFWLLVGRVGRRIEHDEEELTNLATHDGLTGLFNHRTFYMMLEDEAARSQRYGTSVSLLMLDIDHFKVVNDSWGHVAGDRVLEGLANLVRTMGRTVDKVCRYGGEEITMILPETGVEEALLVAERIRRAVEARAFDVGADQPVRITISIGAASLPSHVLSAKELVTAADQALYAAKEGGRNQVRCYDVQAAAGSAG